MKVQANLYEVKEKQATPGGTYNARFNEPPKLTAAASGKEMLEFKVSITDPLGDDYWNTITERVVKQDGVGWASFRMKEIADACGINYTPEGFDTDDFGGKEFKVIVHQEIYKDKMQAKVAHFLKA